MKDHSKTKQALIQEMLSLRQRIAELDQSESERMRAEESLGRSEELYRTFLESTMDMVLLKDDELRHIMVNKPLLDFMGKEENEIIGKTDAELLPQSIAQVCRQTDMEVIQSGAIVKTEEPMHDGIYETRKFPVSIGGGKVGVGVYIRDITDRKRAEEALKQSEEKYRTVVDFTYGWEYWLAPDGKYAYISPACERISGYRAEEFLQDPKLLEKITHPDDRSRLAVHIHDVLQGKSDACQLEFRIITRNNEDRWIGHECQGVYGRDGLYIGRRGSNRDITDRKRVEESLKEKDKFMESIILGSAVATFVVNTEHKVIYWNRACEDLTGIKSEDMLGTSDHWKAFYDHPRPCVADIIVDNAFDKMTNLYKVYAKSLLIPDGICAEGWYPHLGGKNRYVMFDAAPIRDTNGKITAAIETLQDITDRKQAEDALQGSEERLSKAQKISHVGSWELDLSTNRLVWSDEVYRIFGLQPQEFIATYETFLDSIHPDDRNSVDAAYSSSLREGRDSYEIEHRVVQKHTHDVRYVHERCEHVRDTSGRIVRSVGMVQDITERKKAEENLKETLESLRKALGTTIQVMISAIEVRDPYTAGHQIRSSDLARAIATEMGLSQDKIEAIRMAGPIHDIGKLSIPAEILSKPTKLTNIEFSLIKEHVRTGYEMLKDVESPWPLAEIVYQHHERMDGSGYPRNLKGDDILMEARIMAVADVVESMASHRPYRPALGLNAALEEIENNKETLYDADAADACLRLFREKGFQLERA
jgi:PAS domain S-box-containing protein